MSSFSSVVPETRHGYFGDVPYIPPLEASLFFDDLRYCKTHRLPRSHMYNCADGSSFFEVQAPSPNTTAAAERGGALPSLGLLLPVAPLPDSLLTSFPLHDGATTAATTRAAAPSSSMRLVQALTHRWAGVCTTPHRSPSTIEAALRGSALTGVGPDQLQQQLRLHVTYPQRAADFIAVVDAMLAAVLIESSSADDVAQTQLPLHVFVIANVDLLLREPELASELSVFLWCFSSIAHHHLNGSASRLRLVLTALDDEQGRLAVDACHVHLDSVSGIATKQIGTVGTAADNNERPALWNWATMAAVDDEEGNEGTSNSQVQTVGGVAAELAKHVADVHQQICDDMVEGTTSVDASPVIVVWCGSAHHGSGAAAAATTEEATSYVRLVEVELLGRYVAEPMRIATTMDALRDVPLPFDVAPLVVLLSSEAALRDCARIIVARGLALHSVVCLGLGLPMAGGAGAAAASSPATFQCRASLQSDLLWMEDAVLAAGHSAHSMAVVEAWLPRVNDYVTLRAPRADVVSVLSARQQQRIGATPQPLNPHRIADVATFLLWLFRRFGQRSASASAAAPTMVVPSQHEGGGDGTLSNRKQRRLQQNAKTAALRAAGDGITTKPAAAAATPTAEPELVMRVPTLLGGRSYAPAVLEAAVKYLVVSQCCETPPPASTDAEGAEDDAPADASDAAAASGGAVLQQLNELRLILTPLGRVVTEGWKFEPSPGRSAASTTATVLNTPLGTASVVAAKLLLAACTFRVPIVDAVCMLHDGLAACVPSPTSLPRKDGGDAEAWCTQQGLRYTVEQPDVPPDMQHNVRRIVVLWSCLPHLDLAQRALGEPRGLRMNRVEALLCASKATRRALVPAAARSTTCRGWFGSSTVSTTELRQQEVDDGTAVPDHASSAPATAADAVQSYRFPAAHELCEIGVVVGPEGLSFLCETAIELSELLVATKLLVSSMLHNNCVLAQAAPAVVPGYHQNGGSSDRWAAGDATAVEGANGGRTVAIDFKLLRSVTLSSILSGVDVLQTLGGATASGLWLDGKLYDADTAAPTRVEELRHLSQHANSLLAHCDHVAFAKASHRKALKTEAVANGNAAGDTFDGVVPPVKDKRVIDEFITTAVRVGRSRTEANLKGKRGFGFLTEGDVHYRYYAFHMNKAAAAASEQVVTSSSSLKK